MADVIRHAARLLEEAQTGAVHDVLPLVESLLRESTGDLADGPAAYHFVRAVCFLEIPDCIAGIAAADVMLVAAEREKSTGWLSCSMSVRACHRLRLGEENAGEYDVDAVLRDLTGAEAAIAAGDPDPVVAGNAHTGVAIGYHLLRLYELAEPHYQRAYEVSVQATAQTGNPAMWLLNLGIVHLEWALELYAVGEVRQAEKHTAEAEVYAVRAAGEAAGSEAEQWRVRSLLYAASARADRDDPQGAADDILRYLEILHAQGMAPSRLGLCKPFLAVALNRSGRPAEALRAIEEATAVPAPGKEWLSVAALHRTHAVLLAEQGSAGARVGLEYGDVLAAALWRQRQQTLHTAATMRSYEVLRAQHAHAARAAATDPLTGVPNRRSFDEAVRDLLARTGDAAGQPVAVVLVDMDKFKQINDSLGHAAGDAALLAVAGALASSVRVGDLLARLGGDEFGAVLPGADADAAAAVALRMVDAVRRIPECRATVTVGMASGPASAVLDILSLADAAMYGAKRAGGDRVGGLSDRPLQT